ncbi:MAG: DUF427 domain-containing protein [Alphaproteobacteria bacterium]|nr:DUF427 domain-containing protein [Alphaproteobacteria bacterium]MBU1515625.1 DUF427 domain-containing protein [Alphaproteobacteria bacterium]MBU2096960.1 DUF427 domain-containing protein [Alphaproteobacteria bacterium]MBU2149615.1 DUF427 domain-containing protein [Alphaproteobacteria bacterium]MBU2305649.1 DUF427 domain-containing protein [Alphaproteobacteria bacterium]
MKIPGPDHPITVTPAATRWRAQFKGHVIADSAGALVLQESTYPPVIYFPREDVSMDYLSRTAHSTHCPYKGDASYYTLLMDGHFAENAIWTYETPFPAMAAIAGYLAFYPNQVEIFEMGHAPATPAPFENARGGDVDQIVQHTDSGSGAAQREHWPANVETPG